MPRIAMINTVCSGSHGRIMRDLRQAAAQAGFESLIAYGRGPDAEGNTLRFDTKQDILLHVAKTRLFDRHAQGSKAATKRLLSALDAYAPDIVHLHNVHGYYLHAETLFAYLRDKRLPTLWTHHDCWALTGHCSHFVRANCERWQTGCHHCPLKTAYPTSYGLDASRANWRWKKAAFSTLPALRIVSPSHWLDGVLAASYLQDVPRDVIGNGVDLSLFVPGDGGGLRSRYGIGEDEQMLLAVASPFDARKGFGDVLQIAQLLEGRARVVMVGLTEKQCKALPGSVIGIQRADGPEALVALYAAADCLINPTYEDTYPTVNMEAMACGTPVAGYAVGGATEQLAAPGGMPCPVGNAKRLAEAALSLAGRKAELTRACRAHAETAFDRAQALSSYTGLYKAMTGA